MLFQIFESSGTDPPTRFDTTQKFGHVEDIRTEGSSKMPTDPLSWKVFDSDIERGADLVDT